MRKACTWFLPLTFAMIEAALASPADDSAVRNAEHEWQDALNRRDVEAIASLATYDVRLGDRNGVQVRGLPALEAYLRKQQEDPTPTTTEVRVRYLDSDTALVHAYWMLDGPAQQTPHLASTNARNGLSTRVMIRVDQRWRIISSHSSFARNNDSPIARDTAAILETYRQWSEAWSKHDMEALTALVAEDVEFIHVGGRMLRGRAEFHEHHANQHARGLRHTTGTQTTPPRIRFLSPVLAIAHADGVVHGGGIDPTRPDPPRPMSSMRIMAKRDGKWIIIATHNANHAPVASGPPNTAPP